MGGVRTNHAAQASLPGLYAAGEAACTGVHGANRLASNSLLEGLVFGARAALAMADEPAPPHLGVAGDPANIASLNDIDGCKADVGESDGSISIKDESNEAALRLETQQLMWSNVGIVRDAPRLSEAITRLTSILAALPPPNNRRRAEARNIAQSGLAIALSALARTESRGGHFRTDFPKSDDTNFRKHSVMIGDRVYFELSARS
jgi:L-aspartate oxidase